MLQKMARFIKRKPYNLCCVEALKSSSPKRCYWLKLYKLRHYKGYIYRINVNILVYSLIPSLSILSNSLSLILSLILLSFFNLLFLFACGLFPLLVNGATLGYLKRKDRCRGWWEVEGRCKEDQHIRVILRLKWGKRRWAHGIGRLKHSLVLLLVRR